MSERQEGPERIWAEERFWPNVAKSDECWIWTATKMGSGYGAIRPEKGAQPMGAHRFSWALHNGCWPERGQVVMHSCDNPACVNPDHLSVGTQSENVRQAVQRGRHEPYRPEKRRSCKNGHDYTPENTEFINSRGLQVRRCKTCAKASKDKWRARNLAYLAQKARERRATQ